MSFASLTSSFQADGLIEIWNKQREAELPQAFLLLFRGGMDMETMWNNG